MTFIKYLLSGISWGCTVFVLTSVVGYVAVGDTFLQMLTNHFLENVIGSIIVGIGCATPSIVYDSERLTLLQQTAIHFIIGLTTFFIVAITLNWIPTNSIGILATIALINIAMFTFIWYLFYLYNIKEVEKMKQRIIEYSNEE